MLMRYVMYDSRAHAASRRARKQAETAAAVRKMREQLVLSWWEGIIARVAYVLCCRENAK